MSRFFYITVRDNRTDRFLLRAADEQEAHDIFEGSACPKSDFSRRTLDSVYEVISVEEATGSTKDIVRSVDGVVSSIEERLRDLLAEDSRALSVAIANIADQLDVYSAAEIVTKLAHVVSRAPAPVRAGIDLPLAELRGSLKSNRPFEMARPEKGDSHVRITCPRCGASNTEGDIWFRSYAMHAGSSVENNRVIYRDPETGTSAASGGLFAECTVCGHEALVAPPFAGEKY